MKVPSIAALRHSTWVSWDEGFVSEGMKFHVVQGRHILADAPDRDGTGGLALSIAMVAGKPLVLLDAMLERGASLIEG